MGRHALTFYKAGGAVSSPKRLACLLNIYLSEWYPFHISTAAGRKRPVWSE